MTLNLDPDPEPKPKPERTARMPSYMTTFHSSMVRMRKTYAGTRVRVRVRVRVSVPLLDG